MILPRRGVPGARHLTKGESMIRRPSDCWPASLLEEYRRLARCPFSPIVIATDPKRPVDGFQCRFTVDSPMLKSLFATGSDYAGGAASIAWLREGPKIVNVNQEQWEALSRVQVRLTVEEFSMPFPTILFNMPPGKMHEYVVLHRYQVRGVSVQPPHNPAPCMIGCSISYDNTHDIVTLIKNSNSEHIEKSLGKYWGEVTQEEGENTLLSLRVACNMALAMSNYGCQAEYIFPKEVEQDRGLLKRKGNIKSKGGTSASDRLREQPKLLVLDRNVKLYRKQGSHEPSAPTGREMPFHWRSGHWHMVPCGPNRTERKRVLYPPCMVRADLLGDVYPDETTTTYSQ